MEALNLFVENLLSVFGTYAPRILWVLVVRVVWGFVLWRLMRLLDTFLSPIPMGENSYSIKKKIRFGFRFLFKFALFLTILTVLWLDQFASTLLSVIVSSLSALVIIFFWTNRKEYVCGGIVWAINKVTWLCCKDWICPKTWESCDKSK